MKEPGYALALCALGLEKVCAAELSRLGLEVVGREPGRVRFALGAGSGKAGPGQAGLSAGRILARANICLRTAERILIEAASFRATDFDALFEGAREVPWELFFSREDRLVIERVRLHRSVLAAQTSVQAIVHKAIYERLGKAFGLSRLPESGRERSLRVYIEDDEVLLGLDSSGEALHKRGYRQATGEAPLKETVAAGVLLLAGWNRRLPLLDPFCGSGTILIEAGLFAQDRAPGLGRSFGFEDMPSVSRADLAAELEAARSRVRTDADFRIEGSDLSPQALEVARANVRTAGLAGRIELSQAKAEEARPGYEAGILLCNPPYGERLGTVEESEELYRSLGRTAAAFSGWGLGYVTNRRDFGEFFGERSVSMHKIMNGAEEQWFHWYPATRPAPSERATRPAPSERATRPAPADRSTR
ncbi:MAG TPA: class I SAM-dependent RNA methyltransferase, partial [Rectinemataceae bacterium]|nr:class I SAM-dependent RNA methyltransferase [Rectinemataceae bacterium]